MPESQENSGIFVTLIGVGRMPLSKDLRVGLKVKLEKELASLYDDEAIRVVPFNDYDDQEENWLSEYAARNIYVANSVHTVVRGTYSAGRVYDRLRLGAVAQVRFMTGNVAIAEIVNFGYPIGRRKLTEEEI